MRTVLNLFPVKSNHLPGTLCRQAVYLSPAPHAEPQAEAAVSSLSFVHPIRFESAMILASILLFGAFAVP